MASVYLVKMSGSTRTRPVQVIAPRLAERLSAAIEDSQFSAREVAQLSGVDKGTISEWTRADEQVERGVNVERVARVAQVLGTTAEQLLDLSDPQRSGPNPNARANPASLVAPVSDAKVKRMQELIAELAVLAQDTLRHGP